MDVPQSAHASGAPQAAVDEYLTSIERENWEAVRDRLCQPLREMYPSSDVAGRIRREAKRLPEQHTILSTRQVGDVYVVSYSVAGRTWGGGPYEVRLVGEENRWRACGAGLERGVLGFLLMP